MVEVAIPVYKARDTLPNALDSLVAQTKKNFIVCLSIDGDGEDYSDIITEYQRRGLKFRILNEENGGPGAARQHALDTTQCQYIMFLDSDDMYTPRAVEVLYRGIHKSNADMGRSSFVRENISGEDQIIQYNANTITWFHGKIYRVSYLRDNDIRFLPNLRIDEDAYFNLIAWNATTNRIETPEITYIWRHNPNSLTRQDNHPVYFANTYLGYVRSQVCGLSKLFDIRPDTDQTLVILTFINIFYYYMEAKYRGLPLEPIEQMMSFLKMTPWILKVVNNLDNWTFALEKVRCGAVYDNEKVVFFKETFYEWTRRVIGLD